MKKIIFCFAMMVWLTGCLEREEEITIAKDGSVKIQMEFKGDYDDIQQGLALPSGGMWRTSLSRQKDKPEKGIFQAAGQFRDLEECTKAMDLGPQEIQIGQSLRMSREGSKTIYYFRRVYKHRYFWQYKMLKEKEMDEKLSKAVMEKGIGKLKKEDQKRFLENLAHFEQKKRLLQLSDALGEAILKTPFPLEKIQEALSQMEEAYQKKVSPGEILRLLNTPESRLVEEIILLTKALEKEEWAVLQKVFEKHPQVNYQQALQEVRKKCDLTEDLMDENFSITLNLPGRVILSNGEKISSSKVKWKFEGKDLGHREVVLEATSILEEGK